MGEGSVVDGGTGGLKIARSTMQGMQGGYFIQLPPVLYLLLRLPGVG